MRVDIKKSSREDKRYMATFTDDNGNKKTTILDMLIRIKPVQHL